jgi:signal transduction histidine kinase
MLPDRIGDSDYRDLLVRLVPEEVSRIAALAEKLRAMAPSSAPNVPVSLQGVLQSVVALQRSRSSVNNIRIDLEIDSSLPSIAGDQNRLIQLFTNLIQNAVDASPQNSRVLVRATEDHTNVTVDVVDEGNGIADAILERMFEPFLTTKSTGMGLGLSISREIAEAHKARLILENRQDHPGAAAQVVFSSAVSSKPSPT